ncbi:MAG TPA: prepilin-type N-terminal cleavage/methylation domain-containing protein [Gemmatimonadales bacterium]|nr:prepilin-type N-terminal cleavage/methylation domain-containing protein [Gemmatimonadales bacterium]
MTLANTRGYSITEVLVAVLVLGVGVTALVSSSALVTRQIGRGRTLTIATEVATQRLETLRLLARPVNGQPACARPDFAGSAVPDTVRGIVEWWTVSGSGNSRTIAVTVSYPRQSGTGTFTLTSRVGCY